MFILLIASKESLETLHDIIGLSKTFSESGHKVVVFLNEESVNLIENKRYELSMLPNDIILKVCRTSANRKGITSFKKLSISPELSSLGELVDLMEEADRIVFLR